MCISASAEYLRIHDIGCLALEIYIWIHEIGICTLTHILFLFPVRRRLVFGRDDVTNHAFSIMEEMTIRSSDCQKPIAGDVDI